MTWTSSGWRVRARLCPTVSLDREALQLHRSGLTQCLPETRAAWCADSRVVKISLPSVTIRIGADCSAWGKHATRGELGDRWG